MESRQSFKSVGVAAWDRKATAESVGRALLAGFNTRKDSQEDNGETSFSGESLVSDTINSNIPVNIPQSGTRTQPDTQVPTVYSSCTKGTLIASLKQLVTESALLCTHFEELATKSALLRTRFMQERTAASDREQRHVTKITFLEKELKQ